MQSEIVSFLQNAANYPEPVLEVKHIETHISHLFLTGSYAYKLKKAVRFDFLDFTTVEKRKFYCEEEVRLNSRFAPELYLGVLSISRSGEQLDFGAGGEVLDYLVQMRQFDNDLLFDQLASHGELQEWMLLEIADLVARFHLKATPEPAYWGVDYVEQTLRNNIDVCAKYGSNLIDSSTLETLRDSLQKMFLLERALIKRRQETAVRAVHGDMHLKNMCIYQGRARLFDGIEFNPELSNCDVWADLAFFIMDLLARNRPGDAALVWNHYLQVTDDFEGLELLNLYLSYRATVRAKVCLLAHESTFDVEKRQQLIDEATLYLQLAAKSLPDGEIKIIAIGGLSGTGKSTISSLIARRIAAVHIRSDAVRKHLAGISLDEHAPPESYTEEMSDRTYEGVFQRARHVLNSGRSVIIDAVFQSSEWRKSAEEFARERSVPFVGIWCEVPQAIAIERVRKRTADISDADEHVVEIQQRYEIGELTWNRLNSAGSKEEAVKAALGWI